MGITHRSAAKDLAAAVHSQLGSTDRFAYAAQVFRHYVPDETTAPYTVIQNVMENPGWATFGSPAKDCVFQLRVVSQSRGEAEAVDILSAAIGAVMQGWAGSTGTRMTVASHTVANLEYEGSEGYEEDIGAVRTFHRVGRFRIQLCQST